MSIDIAASSGCGSCMPSLLPGKWEVPEVFRARLGDRPGRQRIMKADGHLLVILHRPPAHDAVDREGVFFWRSPKGEWVSTERGSGIAAMTAHFEEWRDILAALEEKLQGTPNADTCFSILQHTAPLLRTMRHTQHAMQEAREAVPEDRAILLMRDKAVDLERTLELLHTDTQHAMEFMIAKQAEEQSKRSMELVATGHRLNLLVALFLPLTAIGSIFGMNFIHGMEAWSAPATFWMLTIGAFLTGLVLLLVLTFRKR